MMHPLDYAPMYCPEIVVPEPLVWPWIVLTALVATSLGAAIGGWLVAEMVRGEP